MNLLKYIIAAAISFVIGLAAMIMGNFLSGILIFGLLFGGYVLFNIVKGLEKEPIPENTTPSENKDN